jgi:hypothetical protein
MTIHIHKSLTEIAIGGQHVRRDAVLVAKKVKKKDRKAGLETPEPVARFDNGRVPTEDTERTWALDAPAELEERLLREVEFSSNHPGGVPLTLEEKQLKEDLESRSRVEMTRMSQALSQMASERIVDEDRALAGKA